MTQPISITKGSVMRPKPSTDIVNLPTSYSGINPRRGRGGGIRVQGKKVLRGGGQVLRASICFVG